MTYSFRIGPLGFSWGFLLAYLWTFSYFGADFSQSMWSVPERGIGLVAMSFIWLLFFVLSQPFASSFLRRATFASFFPSIPVSLFAIYEAAVSSGRPDILFGNAAFLASYLLLHAFIGLYLARSSSASFRFPFIAVSGVLMLATFLTETRGAVLGLVAGLIVTVIYDACVSRRRVSVAFAAILILVSSAFFLTRDMAAWRGIPVLGAFAGTAADISGGRAVAWQAARDAIRARPFMGWGFENFDYAFNASYRASFSGVMGAEDFFSKPHNIFLEYAVSAGIPGLALFFIFLFSSFRSLALSSVPPNHRSPLFGFLAAYAASQFFLFDTLASFIPFILVLAHVASHAPSRPVPAIMVRIGSILALIFLSYCVFQSVLIARSRFMVSRAISFMASGDLASAFSAWGSAYDAGGPYRYSVARQYAAHVQDAVSRGIGADAASHAARAMAGLAAAIAAHPDNYFYRMAYADAAPAFSRHDASYLAEGLIHAERAISLSPHRAEARYALAKIYSKQNDALRAALAAKEGVSLDPDSGDAHFFYGFTLLSLGKEGDGFAEVSRAAALGRVTRTAREAKMLADWHGDAGDYDRALHEYGRALSHDPDNPDILFNQALVLYYGGDRAAASRSFAEIGERFPGFRESSRYRAASPIFRLLGLPSAP